MNLIELINQITPELIDRALMDGRTDRLLTRVAGATGKSKSFEGQVSTCMAGASLGPKVESESPEHRLTNTALIDGIQIGVKLAILAQAEVA